MLRLDLICLTNSGINAARISTVSPMIDSTHDMPPSSSRPTKVQTSCQPTSATEMT